MEENRNQVPVELYGIFVSETSKGIAPVVVLKTSEDDFIPIYVGLGEALSAQRGLEDGEPARPFTHDLIEKFLDELEIDVNKIVIDELENGVFFAQLILEKKERSIKIDSRPSDCIAIAARTGSEILMEKEVIEDAGKDSEEIKDLKDFKDYF
ncbi:MAG: Bifunctional nuclease with DNase and RNase activity [Candidatus Methanohalarchaeum thermophilum]|uniref:Bifunctional nuclease with DNase and RNase activity n=1 Tax=Methanohalarchaeum thermophilum TaxID=1903181 RepID=A0A1Q6DWZ9_METT1|nr:MAG: Bifunctional nuclease with DNase and RNase activity [Candidatus Methanohalarchaeum thermophilum]